MLEWDSDDELMRRVIYRLLLQRTGQQKTPGPIERALRECDPEKKCKLTKAISVAMIYLNVLTPLQSADEATKRAKWLADVMARAGELARLLENPPGIAASDLQLSPADIVSYLRELESDALAAIEYRAEKDGCLEEARAAAREPESIDRRTKIVTPVERTKEISPLNRAVWRLAIAWRELTGEAASVTRINDEGDKGGPFCAFVWAVFIEHTGRSNWPSAETIAAALRNPPTDGL